MADQTHILVAIRDEARAQLSALRQILSSSNEIAVRIEALGGSDNFAEALATVFGGFDWETVPDLSMEEASTAIQAMASVQDTIVTYASKLYPLLRE